MITSDCAKILLVEDHEPTRRVLCRILATRGYQVIEAATMRAGLTLAEQHQISFVISDIGLPDGDGYTLMEALRRDHGLRGIAVSAYNSEGAMMLSREAGFLRHIVKPPKIQLLLAILEQEGIKPASGEQTVGNRGAHAFQPPDFMIKPAFTPLRPAMSKRSASNGGEC